MRRDRRPTNRGIETEAGLPAAISDQNEPPGGPTKPAGRTRAQAPERAAAPASRSAKSAIKVSRDILAAIVEFSDAAIIGKTVEGIVTNWNRGAERMFGYHASEIVGRPIQLIAVPHRPREMDEILDRVRLGQRVEQHETERRRKDGRSIHVSITVSPVLDAKGRVVGVSKIVQDITAQKRVEAQLLAQSAQLQEFVHALDPIPAMVRRLDGRILFWTNGLSTLYGWRPDEAIGRISHDLLRTEFPVPRTEIEAALLAGGSWQGELIHHHRDGSRVIAVSHWTLHRDDSGAPVSVLEFNTDMTEARHAQEIIAEREARLRSILETAPDAIITIDARGTIQSFSNAAQEMFGYAAGEVIGRNVAMLMSTPHAEQHDGYLKRYLTTGEKRIIGIGRQVEARRKNGAIFPMDLSVGEVKLGATHIFTGFIRDLTTRVKLEQDLLQAQKMDAIGQLTGGMAHDFNNLLTVIGGNLEMVERALTKPADREMLQEAQEAVDLGAKLASRLLAFGRRQPLQPKPIQLNALVSGMTDLLRRSLGMAVRIETRLADQLPMTRADPGQVENALLNLAINARDAMPDGGTLVIETVQTRFDAHGIASYPDVAPGDYVTLAVTDTGTGMSAEIQRRAFEPFFTTKGPGVGSGLGLSMVYGFVKQSGGHMQLYSEVGQGTTIRIHLPQLDGDASCVEDGHPVPLSLSAAGETVLVVEDDPRVRRVTVRRLTELGYSVLEAADGPAALVLLEEGHGIDVLLTDVVMPGGISGFELARRAGRMHPRLKIMLTSGYADPSLMKGKRKLKNAAWLGKPHTIAQLRIRLRELIDC
jgi:PAS domain S-box-containing protein